MYFIKTPSIFKKLFPSLIWDIPTTEKELYITFDDGPTPELTFWIMEELKKHDAQATFFCVGNNVCNHPEVYGRLFTSNHAVGNHTFNHLNGWKTKNKDYFRNIQQCKEFVPSKLFRPPYGKLKFSQISALKDFYKIIMWDVLSGDFDKNVSKEQCLKNSLNHIKPGSIIVFHDNERFTEKIKYVLPKFLKHFSEKGYSFLSL
ncbi:MAG: polysaccharide deacetylase family protein [Bacteroidia bacterium]|nr:polysaccharide deacetylase family protein [Bacteroidia bacterium]